MPSVTLSIVAGSTTQLGIVASIGGNSAGTAGLISTGTVLLIGGNNVTLSQNGQSISFIAGGGTGGGGSQSIQTQGSVVLNGSSGSLVLTAGSNITLSQNASTITINAASQTIQTQGMVSINGSTGSISLVAGNNITLSQNASTVTVSANAEMPVGISNIGNTLGSSGLLTGQLVLAGGNNITLSQSTVAGQSGTITISAAAQTVQTQGSVLINGSSGSIVFTAGANISLSQNASTITISASNQSVQTQNLHVDVIAGNTAGATASISSGTMTLAGGNNITLSQAGNVITISGPNTAAQTVQTQNLHVDVIAGNTAGVTASISSGTMTLAGGNNITLSQVGNAITISGPNVGGAQTGISSIIVSNTTYTSGAVSFSNANNISFGSSAGQAITASFSQSVQTQNLHVDVVGGNTAGATASISSGTMTLAGGNNITLSQAGNAITISGANVGGAQTGISSIIVSNTTYTSGAVSFSNANGISFGSSAGQAITASYTVPTQTAQTLGLYGSSQTVGQSSSSTVDARSLSVVGQGIISLGMSAGSLLISATQSAQTQNVHVDVIAGNTAGVTASVSSGTMTLAGGNNITLSQAGNAITISGPNVGGAQTGISSIIVSNTTYTSGAVSFSNANGISFGSSAGQAITASYTVPTQTAQTIGFYASSQTVGQSSSSTVDARSVTVVGQGIISAGMSAGSLLISATTAQSAQSVGVYASSQTVGQSSSSTVDARSFTHVGQGIVSVGMSGGSLLISATTAQSVQTQNLVDVSLSGNTAGALALISSGTAILAGGNNITLSQNGQSITISGPNVGGAQTGISSIIVSNTTYTSGAVSFSNANGISFGSSAGQAITASYTVPTQTVQTLGIYASSQSFGQSSSSTVDARSLTVVGQGVVSVGMSAGSLLVSATTVAQTVQTLGLYGSSQTVGQSSSTTVDARSLTVVGQGIVSVGMSAGSLLVSATGGGGGGIDVSLSGNTAGVLALISSGTAILAGGNNITLSQNGQSVTISGPNTVAQSNQTAGIYGSSQSFGQSSSSTYDVRSLSIVGSNAISVGWSNSSLVIADSPAFSIGVSGGNTSNTSGVVTGEFILAGGNNITLSASTGAGGVMSVTVSGANEMPLGISNIGNTSGSSGLMTGQLVFAGGNNVTLSQSTVAGQSATMTISAAPEMPVGISNIGNTSGTSSMLTGQLVLAGGNNITLSLSTVAGQSGTLTISAPNFATAAAAMGAGVSTGGNTLGNTGTVTGQLVLVGGNNITLSGSTNAGSITVTISQREATLSRIYAGPNWQAMGAGASSQITMGSASIQYIPVNNYVSFSRVDIPLTISLGTAANNSTAYLVYSALGVIYSNNASTLSPIAGGSVSQTLSWQSNAGAGSISGGKMFSFPIATLLTPGEYWLGFYISTSSGFTSGGGATTALNVTMSALFQAPFVNNGYNDFNSNSAITTNEMMVGLWTTQQSATNATIAMSQMSVTGSNFQRANTPVLLRNY
jgi:hypothetical protein